MMSGSSIPYHLRPNKFIDREIFIDCIRRALGAAAPEHYAYMSMGGKHLVDHHLMYVSVGIPHLFSFDMDKHVVDRQKFNKPFGSVKCRVMPSEKFLDDFDAVVEEYGDVNNFIVWLDFTSHHERLTQLQQFQSLLRKMQNGDIVRLTVNADPRRVSSKGSGSWPGHIKTEFEYRLEKFKRQMGDFCGALGPEDMSDERYPLTVAQCVTNAARSALSATGKLVVKPLNIQWYSDGTPMLSTTCAVLSRDEAESFLQQPSLSAWPYISEKWSSVRKIQVPDLSVRERVFIDRSYPGRTVQQIVADLGFYFEGDESISCEQVSSYLAHNRFYPSFKRVDA